MIQRRRLRKRAPSLRWWGAAATLFWLAVSVVARSSIRVRCEGMDDPVDLSALAIALQRADECEKPPRSPSNR